MSNGSKGSAGASRAKICPGCGNRSKPSWEFCPACGEDLRAVAPGKPAAAGSGQPGPPARDASAYVWGGLAALLVAGIVGAVVYVSRTTQPKPVTDADRLIVFPTLAPSPSQAEPLKACTEAQACYLRGWAALSRKDAVPAVQDLQKAVSLASDRPEYRAALGRALLLSGDAEGAVAELEQAVAGQPSQRNLLDLAMALMKAGRHADAIASCERVLVETPGNEEALDLAALASAQTGRNDQALSYRKQLAEASPNDLVAQQNLAVAYEKGGERQAAIRTYRTILEGMPAAAVTRNLLSELLLKEGSGAEAVRLLREGVEAQPGNPLLVRQLASVLERTGNAAEAAATYRRYATLAPNAQDAEQLRQRAAALESAAPVTTSS